MTAQHTQAEVFFSAPLEAMELKCPDCFNLIQHLCLCHVLCSTQIASPNKHAAQVSQDAH